MIFLQDASAPAIAAPPSAVVTPPTWLRTPTDEQLQYVLPGAAVLKERSGGAKMRCEVRSTGVLTDCVVLSEQPAGYGFGTAALALAPSFLMKPKLVDGRPVDGAPVVIPIHWEINKTSKWFTRSVRVVPWMIWSKAPSAKDVADVFPRAAREKGVFGHVTMMCRIRKDGRPNQCRTTQEQPPSSGFDAAAQKLLNLFQADTSAVNKEWLPDIRVTLAFDFSSRALQPAGGRWVREADWSRTIRPEWLLDNFPAEALKVDARSGGGLVACRIGATGALEDCRLQSEAPAGLGFGDAALKVASVMQANLWTRDGEPAVGQKVSLPINLVHPALTEAQVPKPAARPAN